MPRPGGRTSPLALLVPALRAGLYLVVYVFVQFAVALLVVYPAIHDGSALRPGGFDSSVELSLLAVLATIPPQLLVTWLFVRYLDRRTSPASALVWNFAVACLLSLPVSGVSLFHLLRVATAGNPEVTGGGFGPEGSAVLT